MGVVALSYICALLMRRSWWEGVLLVLASVPIALISNAARIVVTGLCYQWFSGEAARRFAHDFSGYVMIVFAAGLFGLTLWYLRWLIQDSVTMDQASLKRV
jgi:exosortase/archaeosortase family protein